MTDNPLFAGNREALSEASELASASELSRAGWDEVYDESRDRSLWVNRITGEVSRTEPKIRRVRATRAPGAGRLGTLYGGGRQGKSDGAAFAEPPSPGTPPIFGAAGRATRSVGALSAGAASARSGSEEGVEDRGLFASVGRATVARARPTTGPRAEGTVAQRYLRRFQPQHGEGGQGEP